MPETVAQEKFLQIYGSLLVRTWEDEALKQRFLKTPAEVLKEFGLDSKGAHINIIKPWEATDPSQCTPESAVTLWNAGLESGEITFVYPDHMPEGAENMELTVHQMEAVAAGDSCCCCCTPCCSCS
jgi:methionine salvage enolase-phosphatase E1